MTNVVIYGASGFTGRLVAKALGARNVAAILCGRHRHRLEALATELAGNPEVELAPIHDDDALRDMATEARVVINCAGPFSTLGEPIVRAALEGGAHYLDTSNEQAYLRDIYERFDSAARKRNVSIINSLAFEAALGDWAASLAAEKLPGAQFDEVSVSYALEGFRPTTGTGISMLASLERGGYVWAHDRWEPCTPAVESRTVAFPEPFGLRQALSFPSGEVITVPRHIDARRVQTFLSVTHESPLGRALGQGASIVGPVLGAVIRSPLGALARAKLGETTYHPSPSQRRRARFALVARAERSFERAELSITGTDPYALTAEIVANATIDLLGQDPKSYGVITPAQAFDANEALEALSGIDDFP